MITTSPSVFINCQDHNAENPLWHPHHQCLYWTDIPAGKMYRFLPNRNKYEQIYEGTKVGGFTMQADGSLLLLKAGGTVEIWREGKITTVIPEIPAAKDTRFNDAIADPEGRVFSGIMGTDDNAGQLYRIDPDGSYRVVVEDLLLPNGMGFSTDCRYFYLTDSDRRTIYRFNYDRSTGELSNQEVAIVTSEAEGVPDGMTVDTEDYIWSARWNHSRIYRYSPEGKEVSSIELPVPKISCVTFGGENYDRLFISSAREKNECNSPEAKRSSEIVDPSGDIFHHQPEVLGRPEFLSRIGL